MHINIQRVLEIEKEYEVACPNDAYHGISAVDFVPSKDKSVVISQVATLVGGFDRLMRILEWNRRR
jgi:hypothetical protein